MTNNRIKNIMLNESAGESSPIVVAVLSGKGGVGKSVIAYNVAAIIAHGGHRCLIIDCDWNFGNQHILANIVPRITLTDLIHDVGTHKYAAEINERLHLIAAPSAGETVEPYNNENFARFLGGMKEQLGDYDYIILDTPSGVIDIIALAAGASDFNLIIANPELTSIADTYGLFKYLIHSNSRISAHILLNRVDCEEDYRYVYEKLTFLTQRFLDRIPFDAGYLLDDRHVIESVAKQKSLIEIYPDSAAVRHLSKLCKILTGQGVFGGMHKETTERANINKEITLADIKE